MPDMVVTITVEFLKNVYDHDFPKEICKKALHALRILLTNPHNPGLNLKPLQGKAKGLHSIRVDDDYRIILQEMNVGVYIALFVGKHDDALRFADRIGSAKFISTAPPIEGIYQFQTLSAEASQIQRNNFTAKIPINDLESMIKTRKYLPIASTLMGEQRSSVQFTFGQLEKIIDGHLPPSARKYHPWWANDRGRHVQASSWLGVGWKVHSVDLNAETVTFIRQA